MGSYKEHRLLSPSSEQRPSLTSKDWRSYKTLHDRTLFNSANGATEKSPTPCDFTCLQFNSERCPRVSWLSGKAAGSADTTSAPCYTDQRPHAWCQGQRGNTRAETSPRLHTSSEDVPARLLGTTQFLAGWVPWACRGERSVPRVQLRYAP